MEKNDGIESMIIEDYEKVEVGSDEGSLYNRTGKNQSRTRCRNEQNQICRWRWKQGGAGD